MQEEDWLSKAMKAQECKEKRDPWARPIRIVSWKRYQEAEKAQNDGATPREIELCLAGAKWPDEVKRYLNE